MPSTCHGVKVDSGHDAHTGNCEHSVPDGVAGPLNVLQLPWCAKRDKEAVRMMG